MISALSALDIHYLIREWDVLIDAKVDKIFSNNQVFLIQLHAPNIGKKYLKIVLPSLAFITENKEEFAEPDNLCIKLRKSLSSSRLRRIEQKDFERIIEFTFEKKDEKYLFVVELFSKGNIILCDGESNIIIAKEYQNWSERTVRGGIKYKHPRKEANFLKLDEGTLSTFLSVSVKNSIVVSLAKDLGLGGDYAEELCSISKIDKTKMKLKDAEIKRLLWGINDLSSRKILPVFYEKEGIFPFPLKSIDSEYTSHQSFNALIDEKISNILERKYREEKNEKFEKKISQLQGIIRQQESQIKGLKDAVEENQKKGDVIYHNFMLIEKILNELRGALKNKDISEIKDKIKGHKIIKNIDTKNKEITLELS